MQILILSTDFFVSSFFSISFVCNTFEMTLKVCIVYSNLYVKLGYVPQNAFCDSPNLNSEKWREALKSAPEKNLLPHLNKFQYKNNLNLDANFVVGLTDADGCFSIYFVGDDLKLFCEFDITLIAEDKKIIESLLGFFQVGILKKRSNAFSIKVDTDWQLYYSILPFFEQHSLLTKKKLDFIFFREIVRLKVENKSLLQSPKQRPKIKMLIATYVYTYFSQTAGKRERSKTLKEIEKILKQNSELPLLYFQQILLWNCLNILSLYFKLNPWYVSGYVNGDGGTSVTVDRKSVYTFSIACAQEDFLIVFKNYFGVGQIYFIKLISSSKKSEFPLDNSINTNSLVDLKEYQKKPHWRFLIFAIQDLIFIHENHFRQYPISNVWL